MFTKSERQIGRRTDRQTNKRKDRWRPRQEQKVTYDIREKQIKWAYTSLEKLIRTFCTSSTVHVCYLLKIAYTRTPICNMCKMVSALYAELTCVETFLFGWLVGRLKASLFVCLFVVVFLQNLCNRSGLRDT